jgi:hypothetical protein
MHLDSPHSFPGPQTLQKGSSPSQLPYALTALLAADGHLEPQALTRTLWSWHRWWEIGRKKLSRESPLALVYFTPSQLLLSPVPGKLFFPLAPHTGASPIRASPNLPCPPSQQLLPSSPCDELTLAVPILSLGLSPAPGLRDHNSLPHSASPLPLPQASLTSGKDRKPHSSPHLPQEVCSVAWSLTDVVVSLSRQELEAQGEGCKALNLL